MTLVERKNHLHQLVVVTNDDLILEKVELFFEQLLHDSNIDWWNTISDSEKEMIEAGLEASKAGKLIPHEDVRKKALPLI